MNSLTVFVWNDDETVVGGWVTTVRNSGIQTVTSSSDRSVEAVFAAYQKENPDVVVLDIVDDKTEQGLGIDIARRIREVDLLVPIIAITRQPAKVYSEKRGIEELGFAGIYHDSVMARDLFGDIALRQSLDRWHVVAVEYVLFRRCIYGLRQLLGEDEPAFCNGLVDVLRRMPFAGSMESWHPQLCSALSKMMKERGFPLREQYEVMANLFQKSDPFHMAASEARRHLSHNVQVFLLGLVLLLECAPLRRDALISMNVVKTGSATSTLVDVILIWACIATTHDTAYLSENLKDVSGKLLSLAEVFRPAVKGAPPLGDPWPWPTVHHGIVAAEMWRQSGVKGPAMTYVTMVAEAIRRHDSSIAGAKPVHSRDWASFLAVLCDELQDWGRSRYSDVPSNNPRSGIPWRLFSLEVLRLSADRVHCDNYVFTMQFVARDYPKVIKDVVGMDAKETIENALRRTIGILAKNLISANRFQLELNVQFATRMTEPLYIEGELPQDI